MIKLTTGERIDELIKKSGKSGEKVLKEINDKYSSSLSKPISKATLSDITNDVDKGYSYKYFEVFAKYFNVSTDYLLCLTDIPTPLKTDEQRALRTACDYTKLSEETITKLRSITHYPIFIEFNIKHFLESLICYGYISDIVYFASLYSDNKLKSIELRKEIRSLIKKTKYCEDDFKFDDKMFHNKVWKVLDLLDFDENSDKSIMKEISEKRQQLFDCEDKQDIEMFKAQKSLNDFFSSIDKTIEERGENNDKG